MKEIVKTWRAINADYGRGDFISDDDETKLMKDIVSSLPPADRVIFLLYAEYRSYRKLGAIFGLSYGTVRKEVLRIRNEIIREYERLRKHTIA